MTRPKVSDYLLERLRAWDVELVFVPHHHGAADE